tara:strand:+ start:818 stop:1087 length:270 start_codon:yes stop_codon:yes gene_type:complete
MELPTNGRFVSVERASSLTGLSISVLRRRKADGSFTAGEEYIYRSGKKGGPVGWDPIAIENWQIKQSQLIADVPAKAADEIETFAAMGV